MFVLALIPQDVHVSRYHVVPHKHVQSCQVGK